MVHFFNCLWYSSLLTLDRQQFCGRKWNARCADESSVAIKMEAAVANDMSDPQHNDKPKPHKCTVCNKRFATEGNLLVHIQMHTQQKSYSCPECEKCYNNCKSLRIHMYIHKHETQVQWMWKVFPVQCWFNQTQTNSFWRETVWMFSLWQTIYNCWTPYCAQQNS